MKAMEETYLTMTEAAARMAISYVTLYRAVESGKVLAIKTPGGRRRIPESEVARYWQEQDYNPNGVENEHQADERNLGQ
jgi:excisionase family DNA binding protein